MLTLFLQRSVLFIRGVALFAWLCLTGALAQGALLQVIGVYAACMTLSIDGLIITLPRLKHLLRTIYNSGSRWWIVWPFRVATIANVVAYIAAVHDHRWLLALVPLACQWYWMMVILDYRLELKRCVIDWNGVNPPNAWSNPILDDVKPGDIFVSGHPFARGAGVDPDGHIEIAFRGHDGRMRLASSNLEYGMTTHDLEWKVTDWKKAQERYFVLGVKQELTEEESNYLTAYIYKMCAANRIRRHIFNANIRKFIDMLPIPRAWNFKLAKFARWSGYNFVGLVHEPAHKPRRVNLDIEQIQIQQSDWTCVSAIVEMMEALGRSKRHYGVDLFGLPFGIIRPPIFPWQLLDDPAYRLWTNEDKKKAEARLGITIVDPVQREAKKNPRLIARVRDWFWGVYV
jgi:hypothetical protein